MVLPADAQGTTSQMENDQTLDNAGYCLLSLDGGGVRGLSTLYILQSIMRRLNYAREEKGLSPKKPCEIFDLIGGTSTGGLIAIMLGRLEMSVDECIEAYTKMMKHVFEKKQNRSLMGLFGDVKPRFSSKALEDAIKNVTQERGASAGELFENGTRPRCRVFVCTKTQETSRITRMRSYRHPMGGVRNPSILEAALATSAAPTYFDPVMIEGSKYVDGAIGANNPAMEVEGEASDLWCEETGHLQPLVKCFVSIGTGHPGIRRVSDKGLKHFVKTLSKEATETESTNQSFLGRWRDHCEKHRCFRFNVDHGLEEVGLAEYAEQSTIKATTHNYLESRQALVDVRHCVENLRQKEYHPNPAFIESVKLQALLEPRPAKNMARATPSEISELINAGNSHLKVSSDRITVHELLQALQYFSKALQYSKERSETSPKQVTRLCQKLMDTSLRLSFMAGLRLNQGLDRVEDARRYCAAALENALISEDQCMAAQMRFWLSCIDARRICLEARRSGLEPKHHSERNRIVSRISQTLEELREYENLDITGLEAQASIYSKHLTDSPRFPLV